MLINQRIQDETKTTKIVVKPSYQIRTIKTLIQDITKIPVADQILKMNNAAELSETPILESENDKKLSCFEMEDNGQIIWLYDARKKEISIFRDRLQTMYFDLEIPDWNVSALDVKQKRNLALSFIVELGEKWFSYTPKFSTPAGCAPPLFSPDWRP